jgi:predicted anti-sigma-YlaC factor YlaD
METGRKFWITLYGMTGVLAYAFYAALTGFVVSEAVLSALATMVLAFCGGNATASIAASLSNNRNTNVNETVTRDIKARRTDDGTEDTP